MKRLFKVFLAKLRCNIYCIWQALGHYNFVCEFNAYNKKNRLILIATTKDSLWNYYVKGKEFSIDKVFYKERNNYAR